MTQQAKEYGFQAEMEQLLHLIIHSLYSHKEIFLRELISNASDAINKMRFTALTEKGHLDEGKDFRIDISFDEKEKEIHIKDNGIGMNEQELVNNIGTIASSGTLKFIEEMKKNPDRKTEDLIGQFGVGFYSVFMVTEEVTLRTRSYKQDSKGLEWKSKGTNTYTIAEIDKADRGTEIIFKLKQDSEEYANEYQLKNIIQKYSNFVDFPIFLKDEQINTVQALWRKSPSEVKEEERNEFYKFIANDFTEPFGYVHLKAEAPLAYSALLFVPKTANNALFQRPDEFQLSLYIKKVFIQNDNKELLPQYLRFVRGVVDSEDLPLNVSREVTQVSPIMGKIKKALTNRLLKQFEEWATKERDKYKEFYDEFGNILKEGIHFDFENKERIVELLRFKTTKTEGDEKVSLATYVERMGEKQKDIYFLTGESIESLRKNPNLEYFKKHDIEVLLLDETIDDFIIPNIEKYKEKELKDIDKADLDIEDKKIVTNDGPDGTTRVGFLDKVKGILGDKVSDVKESRRLVDSPCTLVTSSDGMNSQMERMMKMMDANYKGSKKIFEINLTNPIVSNLINIYKNNENDINLRDGIFALYEGSLLQDGNLEDVVDFVKKFHNYMEKATSSRIIT